MSLSSSTRIVYLIAKDPKVSGRMTTKTGTFGAAVVSYPLCMPKHLCWMSSGLVRHRQAS
jgi:hypothetical protein